jgi:hypothetical protein
VPEAGRGWDWRLEQDPLWLPGELLGWLRLVLTSRFVELEAVVADAGDEVNAVGARLLDLACAWIRCHLSVNLKSAALLRGLSA